MDDELPEGNTWLNQDGLSLSNYCRHGTIALRFPLKVDRSNQDLPMPGNSGHIIVWVYIQEDSVPDAFWFTLINNKEKSAGCSGHRIGLGTMSWGKESATVKSFRCQIRGRPSYSTDDLEHGHHRNGHRVSKKEGSASISTASVIPQPVYKIPFPHVPLRRERRYSIYRNEELIGYSDSLEYNDNRVLDIGSGTDAFSYQPIYSIRHNELDDTIRISWTVPSSEGTEYDYKVISHDALGGVSSAATLTTTVAIDHAKTEIIISSENTPEYSVITTDSVFVQEDIIYGDTYRYTIISYDSEGMPTSTVIKTYTVPYGSCLDSFVLDESPLA